MGVIENAVTLIISIMSLSVGAVIAFLVARYYYQRAAKDLEKEAKELRRLTTLILRGLEEAGLVDLKRDQTGQITALKFIKASGTLSGGGKLQGSATVGRAEETDGR